MKLVKSPDDRHLLHLFRTDSMAQVPSRHSVYLDWNNLRFATRLVGTSIPCGHFNPRKRLPFDDETFDSIYCNHVIEHLTPHDGLCFTKEIYRVLKRGGVCRIVTPDLGMSAEEYIRWLRAVQNSPNEQNLQRYEWAFHNLVDQMIRRQPGGMMAKKLLTNDIDWDQLKRCNGDVLDGFRTPESDRSNLPATQQEKQKMSVAEAMLRRILKMLGRILPARIVGGLQALRMALTHEKNVSAYDEVSLPRLLTEAGFKESAAVTYKESRIENWQHYDFDCSAKGDYPIEPSVYAEGIRHTSAG